MCIMYWILTESVAVALCWSETEAASSSSPQYKYKHNHVLDKGKHIGIQSVQEDPLLLHCLQAGRLASDQEYRRDALTTSGQYHLSPDMIHLVTAKNAQSLASEQDYRTRLHKYTVLPDDMKVQWAKKAYDLQSEVSGRGAEREDERRCQWDKLLTNAFLTCVLETLQVGPQFHERSGLGRSGCTSDGVGQESWRTYKWCEFEGNDLSWNTCLLWNLGL